MKIITNKDLVLQQQVDRFKENLKFCLIDGASLLSCEELEKASQEVFSETFRWLNSSPKGNQA